MEQHGDTHHHSKAHDRQVRRVIRGAAAGGAVGLALLIGMFVLLHTGPKETGTTAMRMPGASVVASTEAAPNR